MYIGIYDDILFYTLSIIRKIITKVHIDSLVGNICV
jgi:hypothetical protein